MRLSGAWHDGFCRLCGAGVEEMPVCGEEGGEGFDYKNRCMNVWCISHVWHYCSDDEDGLTYYRHI